MKKLIYLGLVLAICSCKKSKCPEPIIPTPQDSIFVATLQPGSEGKDALLFTLNPTTNYGDKTYFEAKAWTTGIDTEEKGILQFDYSAIPAGAKIVKATLTLFADTTTFTGSTGHSQLSGSNAWVLKRVTQSWNESTVTWNNQPTTDLTNMIQMAASTSASQAYVIDLTSWVKDEISNPTSFYGFVMEINNKTPYRSIMCATSDNQISGLHPKMVIEYTK